jgi:hypothetical protein
MVVEDSVRYRHPADEADREFLSGFPSGEGALPLGTNNLATFISMYHQLDCMHTFGQALTKRNKVGWKRMEHCLGFLREAAMCQADMTLELGNFAERNFTVERHGEEYVCQRDWTMIAEASQSNWVRWRKEKANTG